jgi:NAD(P)H dehydrogenase (quinone)
MEAEMREERERDAHTGARFELPRHLIVLGHPDLNSFCATIARACRDAVQKCGHAVALHDLYASGFDPRLKAEERPGERPFEPGADIAEQVEALRAADVITLVYPLWFGMPPAIIKGYIDRVMGAGFNASGLMHDGPVSTLAGKRLMLFTSSASTRPWLEEKGQWSALRRSFETYLQTIFGLWDGGHTHFDAVVPGLKPRFVEECAATAGDRMRAVSAEVLREKRARQIEMIREGAAAEAAPPLPLEE